MTATTSRLYRATLAQGGGTFTADGIPFNGPGCAVALVDGTFATVDALAEGAFAEAIVALRARWPQAMVGTWLDAGRIHVDPIEVLPDRATADTAARARGQIAYYDLSTETEVRIA